MGYTFLTPRIASFAMSPKKKLNAASAKCKYCKMTFDEDPNPCSKDPGPDDVVRRRCANSKDCKHCYGFIRNHEEYAEMSATAIVEHLENPQNQEKYDQMLDEWCKTRREGGRRGRGRGTGCCQKNCLS